MEKKGWLYEEYKNKPVRFIHMEWVYFNFLQDNIKGIFTFGNTGVAPGVLLAQLFPNGQEPLCLLNTYKENQVERSKTNDNITIKNSTLDQITETHYKSLGRIETKKTSLIWDLDYNAVVSAMPAFDHEKVGVLKNPLWPISYLTGFQGEWLSWKIIMPQAKIKGVIYINENKYDIDAIGYMDSNWGHWGILDAHWNWVHCNGTYEQTPYTVAGLQLQNDTSVGFLGIKNANETINETFSPNTFIFEHLKWKKDEETGLDRPILTKLTALNLKGYSLDLLIANQQEYTLIQHFPFPLIKPDYDLLESFVTVKGTLKKYNETLVKIDAKGFKEYGQTSWIFDPMRKLINKFR